MYLLVSFAFLGANHIGTLHYLSINFIDLVKSPSNKKGTVLFLVNINRTVPFLGDFPQEIEAPKNEEE